MKTYVLLISRYFPAKHPRRGESTFFPARIQNGLGDSHYIPSPTSKIHTIRSNYDLWKKRIDEVNAGEAVLSLRYWTGKPYNSKQQEFARLDKNSGIGVQRITMVDHGNFTYIQISNPNKEPHLHSDCVEFDSMKSEFGLINRIAENDGLSTGDFKAWFKGYDLSKPMAIIHFTEFRY